MSRDQITLRIKEFAKTIGVDLIGIAPAEYDEQGEQKLADFIQEGRHGQMAYLENYQKRVRPQELLPEAKSVIVIAINYYREVPETAQLNPQNSRTQLTQQNPQAQPQVPEGRIARYAYGRDYHKVLKKILKQLAAFIQQNSPTALTHLCVDSSPILEKSFAEKAGLGFIGKNTTLITPEFGSFVLLGELITTLQLDYDQPRVGTCGTCTRCQDACPTKAILSPGQLDARRCISYLTIENRDEIPEEFHQKMGNLIYGCDICQEVCPYNKANAKPLTLKAFTEVKIAGSSIPLQEILNLKNDEEFLARFAGSPLMRAKRKGLQRNARIAAHNAI